jgi:hypothetical protein
MHPDGVWLSCSSSNVEAARRVGEDELEVRFLAKGRQPARTWRYPSGSGRLLESLLAASSPGKYVRYVIRPAFGDGVEV